LLELVGLRQLRRHPLLDPFPDESPEQTDNWLLRRRDVSPGRRHRDVRLELQPGGANFAFCDGSVGFLKETIESWQIGPNGLPRGFSYQNSKYVAGPGAEVGVYQALSTRNGGEVISANDY
jgi:prepilin-type processing-associated H-X9-DG protein